MFQNWDRWQLTEKVRNPCYFVSCVFWADDFLLRCFVYCSAHCPFPEIVFPEFLWFPDYLLLIHIWIWVILRLICVNICRPDCNIPGIEKFLLDEFRPGEQIFNFWPSLLEQKFLVFGRIERSIFQTFWRANSCTDSLFL